MGGLINLKKKIEQMGVKGLTQNLLIILLIAAIVVIAASTFTEKEEDNRNSMEQLNIELNKELNFKTTYEERIESRLKAILEQIEGVGEVSVMVTLKVSNEVVPATNVVKTESQTSEKDSSGGTRTITQKSTESNIVMKNTQGAEEQPLIVKEIMPEVKGVIVVAEGAERAEVEAMITEAVQTVLGIPAFRVKVYPR